MAIRPSTPEIITVNSETLQTQIRDLLPSQNGFGSELQASNVITPIIDLTAAAEGSGLGTDLQTALAFSSQTAFGIRNTTTVIENNAGFYRIFGVSTLRGVADNILTLSDGSTDKIIWQHAGNDGQLTIDFVVFLRSGDSISGQSTTNDAYLFGSSRQIATGDGTLVNPVGYPL